MDALLLDAPRAFLRYHHLAGAAPAVVWLHGLGGAASSFLPVASHAALAGRRHVLVDLLGFGCSDRPADFGYSLDDHADAVAALLDRLELRDSVVFGHSAGGSVATVLAATRPHLAGRLVVLEAVLEQGERSASRAFAAQSEAEFVARGFAEFVATIRAEALAGDAAAVEFLGTLHAAAPFAVHRTAAALTRAAGPELLARFVGLAIPRTSVHGERTLAEPRAAAAADDLAVAGVDVRVVEAAGHHAHVDNPAALAETLAAAIGS